MQNFIPGTKLFFGNVYCFQLQSFFIPCTPKQFFKMFQLFVQIRKFQKCSLCIYGCKSALQF